MKNFILLLICATMVSTSVKARDQIPFTVYYNNEQGLGHGHPKSPMRPPVVYIEEYMLSFSADHPEYVLNIKEENGEVVYSTTIFCAMTQVTLPSTLSGDYEIELLMGNWKFKGFINL